MSFYHVSIFSSGCHCVQRSGTVCANLVKGIMRNIFVKLFCICTGGSREDVVEKCFYLAIWFSICAILVHVTGILRRTDCFLSHSHTNNRFILLLNIYFLIKRLQNAGMRH